MAQMIQVIMRMAHEKGTIDNTSSVNIDVRTQRVIEGFMNLSANFVTFDVGTSHYSIPPLTNVNLEIYPPPPAPMPPRRVYTYPYVPSLVIPNPLIT